MPDNIVNHFGSKFSDRVIHFNQAHRRLRDTVDSKQLTDAKDYTFFRMGTSVAAERARGGTLTAQNMDMPTVLCTPVETSGLHWIDRQDLKRLNYAQSDNLARSLAMELGRKADVQIIAAGYAIDAQAVTDGRAAIDFSAGKPELEHLVEIIAEMEERHVDEEGEITVLVPPRAFAHFLLYPAFNSSDWVEMGDQTLSMKSRIRGKYWNGTRILKHTGLTATGAGTAQTVKCLAYHEAAIGHCTMDEISIETASTLPQGKPGTNIYGFMDMQAVGIEPTAVQAFELANTKLSETPT